MAVPAFTLRYAPPEVIKHMVKHGRNNRPMRVLPSLDMWSLGCLAHEMYTGLKVFGDEMSNEEVRTYLGS